jgi:hypothetical protein
MEKAKGGGDQSPITGQMIRLVIRPTLRDLGVTKQQSSDWQKLGDDDVKARCTKTKCARTLRQVNASQYSIL